MISLPWRSIPSQTACFNASLLITAPDYPIDLENACSCQTAPVDDLTACVRGLANDKGIRRSLATHCPNLVAAGPAMNAPERHKLITGLVTAGPPPVPFSRPSQVLRLRPLMR